MSSSETVRTSNFDGYNRWSSFYDQYPNPTVAIDEIAFPSQWRHVRNKRVLEIGCGTGRHTQKLIAAENHVLGIDLSSGMLNVARKKFRGNPVELVEADFLTYDGLLSNFYDVAISSLVIEHFSDLGSFFFKVADVLKSDGEFFLSEIHPARTSNGIFAHFRDNDIESEVHLDSYPHTQESVEASAKQADLKIISRKDVMGCDALIKANGKWVKYLNIPMIQMWRFRKS